MDLDLLESSVVAAARSSIRRLTGELPKLDAVTALAHLKFSTFGCDPLDVDRPLNFVEQLNQSFTYLATIGAARLLMDRHPNCGPWTLNLGTAGGSDIESDDKTVAAEVFAATHPASNDKLRKDIEKVRATGARVRYVFYLCATTVPHKDDDVIVVSLTHPCFAGLLSPAATLPEGHATSS